MASRNNHAIAQEASTRPHYNFEWHVANNQLLLPFNDLLLKDLTKIASVSQILAYIHGLKSILREFKKDIIGNPTKYIAFLFMLGSNFLWWIHDFKAHERAAAGVIKSWLPASIVVVRDDMNKLEQKMMKSRTPGVQLSNSAEDRKYHHKVVHNLLLTVLMDLQEPRTGSSFFQILLGGPKAAKWPDRRHIHQEVEVDERDKNAPILRTTAVPPKPEPRKNLLTKRGRKADDPITRVEQNKRRDERRPLNTSTQITEAISVFDTSEYHVQAPQPQAPAPEPTYEDSASEAEPEDDFLNLPDDYDSDDPTVAEKSIAQKRQRLSRIPDFEEGMAEPEEPLPTYNAVDGSETRTRQLPGNQPPGNTGNTPTSLKTAATNRSISDLEDDVTEANEAVQSLNPNTGSEMKKRKQGQSDGTGPAAKKSKTDGGGISESQSGMAEGSSGKAAPSHSSLTENRQNDKLKAEKAKAEKAKAEKAKAEKAKANEAKTNQHKFNLTHPNFVANLLKATPEDFRKGLWCVRIA